MLIDTRVQMPNLIELDEKSVPFHCFCGKLASMRPNYWLLRSKQRNLAIK